MTKEPAQFIGKTPSSGGFWITRTNSLQVLPVFFTTLCRICRPNRFRCAREKAEEGSRKTCKSYPETISIFCSNLPFNVYCYLLNSYDWMRFFNIFITSVIVYTKSKFFGKIYFVLETYTDFGRWLKHNGEIQISFLLSQAGYQWHVSGQRRDPICCHSRITLCMPPLLPGASERTVVYPVSTNS